MEKFMVCIVKINEFDGDCIDSDNTVEGATPALGPNRGNLCCLGGSQWTGFNRSLDDGDTWLSQEIAIDPMPTGWDYAIPGIYRGNGFANY